MANLKQNRNSVKQEKFAYMEYDRQTVNGRIKCKNPEKSIFNCIIILLLST